MASYIAIDPGVNKGHGIAGFDEKGTLLHASLVGGLPSYEITNKVKHIHLAIEVPVFRSRLKGIRQQDIIDLAYVAGSLVGRLQPEFLTRLKPEDWKGQVSKEVAIERIKARLTEEELKRVELPIRKDLQDNVWDSIGIGLHVFSPDRSLVSGRHL